MSGPKNALAAWSQSALRPVELPSGMKALIVIPDVSVLARSGKLPSELTATAMKFATSGINVAEMRDPEEIAHFIRLTYALVADSLRYLATEDSEAWDRFKETGDSPADEGWQAIKVTGPELAEMQVDQADVAALAGIVGRVKTPNEVTIGSRLDRGLLTPEGAQAAIAPDAGLRVQDFAPFRGEPEKPDDRPDGGDVRAASVGASRSGGSSRRARARRSPSG